MTTADILTSPFVIFGVAIAIGYVMYFWSRTIAPRPVGAGGDKHMPYVGGEPAVAQAFQPGYQFFYVALFFTLVHVAALVLATAPPGVLPWAAVGYLGVVAAAVMILRWEQ
jgi:NADH:ubiquinone oxidoreductase subunit 3 (subunit A)